MNHHQARSLSNPSVATLDELTPAVSARRPWIGQFIRFGLVGFVNTVVDLAVLNLLIVLTHTGRTGAMFALFKTIAFVCAVLNSYFMNRAWTFQRVPTKSSVLEGSQFLFVNLLGLVVNVGTASLALNYARPEWRIDPKWWPSVAALVGTAFSFAFNFIGYKFWVFAHRKH